MPLSHSVALSLLRVALNLKDGFDSSVVPNNDNEFWNELHRFSAIQGVSALIFESLKSLGLDASMPRNRRIAWALESDKAIRKYCYYSKMAPEFEDSFSSLDLTPVHMKGLAMSVLYPRPELRECGDYDFYLYKITDNPSQQDLHANSMKGEAFVKNLGYDIDDSTTEKHSSWDFNHVHVECHRYLLNLHYVADSALPVEEQLHLNLKPIATRLPDGGEIHSVSPEFALLFVPFHALQHSGTGLRLRHIADWALLSIKYGNYLARYDFSECLSRGVSSLNAMSNLLLGTDFKTQDNTRLTTKMLYAILQPEEYERLNIEKEILHNIPGRLRKFTRRNRLARNIFPDYAPLAKSICQAIKLKIGCR